ncbi:MAG: alkaline phosphatase [Planctomycetota bacterium]|nr:alkaline phosphatase [Planctomycetota bacterium]MDA1251697.1 alkaline phosphatase [Planctomycetota bacterium]
MSQRKTSAAFILFVWLIYSAAVHADHIRDLQTNAVKEKKAEWGYWGSDPAVYSTWISHSNRLIPVYTFGISLDSVRGESSPYRSAEKLTQLYGQIPTGTLNPEAEYFDQTDVYRLQQLAVKQGKKRIVLFVFDGMDWQTTQVASIVRSGKVAYRKGRGTGLAFQDYRGAQTDFGYFVTAPHSSDAKTDVDAQKILEPGKSLVGYDFRLAGPFPWSQPLDPLYPIGKNKEQPHIYTDSASSASAMTSGIKTYNNAINVDPAGHQVVPIARQLQQTGFAVGVVSSVPISHATPASAYANNVYRNDYQDLTRDMLGLPSVSHPKPLPGVDVLLAAGFGETKATDADQGKNFVPGNRYVTEKDLEQAANGPGAFEVVTRTKGKSGSDTLGEAVQTAVHNRKRLFGLFGVSGGHLPFATADGKYDPTIGAPTSDTATETKAEKYSAADVAENPTLADLTGAALTMLSSRSDRFWLMVEAGDVDWANHKNSIDNSAGAVFSGDAAFKTTCDWIEANGGWSETAVILTADHGHYLVLKKPELLVPNR